MNGLRSILGDAEPISFEARFIYLSDEADGPVTADCMLAGMTLEGVRQIVLLNTGFIFLQRQFMELAKGIRSACRWQRLTFSVNHYCCRREHL